MAFFEVTSSAGLGLTTRLLIVVLLTSNVDKSALFAAFIMAMESAIKVEALIPDDASSAIKGAWGGRHSEKVPVHGALKHARNSAGKRAMLPDGVWRWRVAERQGNASDQVHKSTKAELLFDV